MLMGILGHVDTADRAQSIVTSLMDAVPPGSYLTINDGADTSDKVIEAARVWNEFASPPYHLRSPRTSAGFFDGLEVVEPGVVSTPLWRPDPGTPPPGEERELFCGIGRKP
jgi:hypothetical protein